jgi:hypothetical protein
LAQPLVQLCIRRQLPIANKIRPAHPSSAAAGILPGLFSPSIIMSEAKNLKFAPWTEIFPSGILPLENQSKYNFGSYAKLRSNGYLL